jgi:flagella basal body P-ring formation protein FlgA
LDIQHLIEKGHPVAITFQNSVVEVAMPGKALEGGQRGDLIQVRNTASGRILRGRVVERNKIVVEAKMN